MHLTVALLLLIVYFLMSIQTYLATNVFKVFRISFWKLSPTEIRIVLIIGNTVVFFRPEVSITGHSYLLFDIGALCGIVGMLSMVLHSTVRNTVRLYREERL